MSDISVPSSSFVRQYFWGLKARCCVYNAYFLHRFDSFDSQTLRNRPFNGYVKCNQVSVWKRGYGWLWNDSSQELVSITIYVFTYENKRSFWQSKVDSSLACVQKHTTVKWAIPVFFFHFFFSFWFILFYANGGNVSSTNLSRYAIAFNQSSLLFCLFWSIFLLAYTHRPCATIPRWMGTLNG